MKDCSAKDFLAKTDIKLAKTATKIDFDASEDKLEEELADIREKMSKLQDKMYAHNKYSLLVCLQGMDTAGKDSLIREVFKEINPRGVVVSSFKVPSELELSHDYLWRHYIALPERGKIGVFNRTHYENVLVTKVHPTYLLNENLPAINSVDDVTEKFWDMRYKEIVNFEKHITQNGTIVLKFYLHLSKDEQRDRLLRRLEEDKHNWKFSPGDLKERALWDKYASCYEEAINNTSTSFAPWYIIPADDKASARYIVGRIILDELKKYDDIKNPELSPEIKENVGVYKKMLEAE